MYNLHVRLIEGRKIAPDSFLPEKLPKFCLVDQSCFPGMRVNTHNMVIDARRRHEQLRCDRTVGNFMVILTGLTLYICW